MASVDCGEPDSRLPAAEEPYRDLGRRVSMSPVAATKSSAIEIGTSGLLDPPVDAPIVPVWGRVIAAGRVVDSG